MRLLALLFALYLACLSCLPCADEVQVRAEPAQTSVSVASHSDGRGVDHGDWCSPLCQCHCCASAVVVLPQAAQVVPAQARWASAARHAPLLVAAPMWAATDVWQPPQV